MFTRELMALGLCLLMDGTATTSDSSWIDDCRYSGDTAAQAAWLPMKGSAPAQSAILNGTPALRLRCNFKGTTIERASWDRKVTLDLSRYQGVELRFFSRNLAPVGHFAIYFQSGGGWYSGTFVPDAAAQWNTLEIDKEHMRVEGHPSGWNKIEAIRISAWRGRDEDTEFYLGGLRGTGVLGQDALVAILRADNEFEANVEQYLKALGIRAAAISDQEITAAQLHSAKLVILPGDSTLPDRAADLLIDYLNHGGKLLAFYSLPAKLNAAVKIASGPFVRQPFRGLRFTPGTLMGAPSTVGQHSWNIIAAKPLPGFSQTLAEWLDDKGQPSGYPAVIASANCILMTHVLLKDDAANQRAMLLAMIGRLAPEALRASAEKSVEQIGHVGSARDFDDAVTEINRTGKRNRGVRQGIDVARHLRQDANALVTAGNYIGASQKAASAHEQLVDAFAKAQHPLRREFRAFWCHNAAGVPGMTWDEAIKRLADNGFTAIFPNMLWGGAAFYPSQVLPVAAPAQGDQIAQCLAACRKYGLQMHVWKVDWNLGRQAPPEFVERMRKEARLQRNVRGEEEPWLCPSNPANQKLEIDAMVEVARNYDVDGIHFDYIRYPDGEHCFCDGCRERFSKAAGVTIHQWPRDVLAQGPYRQQWLDWRRDNITTVVKAVSEQARRVKPKIKISAAVFRNWAVDRDGVGQDWKLWCERGYLDFVCPMDYTESDTQFDSWVASQKLWAGKTPVYPGIGASSSSSLLGFDRVIGQIQIARKYKAGGFIIFNYGAPEAAQLLPVLGEGITRR